MLFAVVTRGYLFEPEYAEEELLQVEIERLKERERGGKRLWKLHFFTDCVVRHFIYLLLISPILPDGWVPLKCQK